MGVAQPFGLGVLVVSGLAGPERFAPAAVTIPFPQMCGAQAAFFGEGFGLQMGTAKENQ